MPIEYDLSGYFGEEKNPFTLLEIEPRTVQTRALSPYEVRYPGLFNASKWNVKIWVTVQRLQGYTDQISVNIFKPVGD